MRRVILACLFASLLIGAFAAPAAAGAPKPTPPPDSVQEFDAGVVCDFAVRLEGWSNERVRTIVDRHGREKTVITGTARTRATNVDDGSSLVVHTGGVVVIWEPGDGTSRLAAVGVTLFYFFPGDQNPAGEGNGLYLVRGVVDQTLDLETDVVTDFDYHGTYRDLCAALG